MQSSMTIHVSAPTRWTAWAFRDQNDFAQDGLVLENVDDPIARSLPGQPDSLETLIEVPILEPREYFLHILNCQFEEVTDENTKIIDAVDTSIQQNVSSAFLTIQSH
jgi:hypothetical protein